MEKKYSLPSLLVYMSVIISSTTFGLMLPHTRTLPLVVGLMFYTTMYHSALLVSSITNSSSREDEDSDRFKFYMDPIETSHLIWTFCFAIFWTVSFGVKIKALVDGASEDADYMLVVLCGIEWLLNAYISQLSVAEWGRQQTGEPLQRDIADLESSAESAAILRELDELQILYQLVVAREEKRAILASSNQEGPAPAPVVPAPPTYAEAAQD
ncbi:hypothetical protein GALMADRAFT_248049 [Galerina marginata CBS 339.88]|uniref:Uncharacterized protein n=1 Tax=Galerina marginata (strain CBS 339.88) TaxID=685588 RepID=A0A067SZT4_GALM3|nr:hypothetical protein GALMADRAFT_248049 [Galerina marginata CBS 339.88]